MKENTKTKRDNNSIITFGKILPYLPSLIIRSGGAYLRLKKQAKKGGKVFKKELIKQGIDKKTAEDLAEIYMNSSHFTRNIIKLQNIGN